MLANQPPARDVPAAAPTRGSRDAAVKSVAMRSRRDGGEVEVAPIVDAGCLDFVSVPLEQ